MKRIWIVAYVAGLAVGLAASQARPQSPLDTAFTYQGQLKEGAIPANGIYDFQFHLYDAATDGRLIGSVIFDGELMQPHHYPPIHVANGLFTAELDFGADAFNGDARWLEIQVRLHPHLGDPRYTVLSPRQPLNAAPYALYALDGPGGAGGFWAANGADIYSTNSGKVGIGTTTPAATLQAINEGGPHAMWAESPNMGLYAHRTGNAGTWPAVHGDCDSGSSGTSGVRGRLLNETPGADSAGVYGIISSTGNQGAGVRGLHNGSGKGVLGEVVNPDGHAGYFIGGRNYFQGFVGVGTTNPNACLDVIKQDASTADYVLELKRYSTPPFWYGLNFDGASINSDGYVFMDTHTPLNLNDTTEANVLLVGGGGKVLIGPYPFAITLEPYGNGAQVTLKDSGGYDAVRLSTPGGTGGGGKIELKNEDGGTTVRLVGEFGGGGALDLMQKGAIYPGIRMYGYYGVGGGEIHLYQDIDRGFRKTITIDGDWAGRGRITTEDLVTKILYITGGSDLSERFAIRAESDQVKPGMVVSIDPDRPGKLTISREAYDKKVAGIISGAGGLKTGLLMGQSGSVADGDHPVALTGRVYCLCDASKSPIRPGDLLTTSDTPGHAMKVTDYAKAQGAIIGKAMTALDKDTGLVLVLVSLQ